jgi:hypothetical protein
MVMGSNPLLHAQAQALGWHDTIYKWGYVGDDSVVLVMNAFPVGCPRSTIFYLLNMHATAEWDAYFLLGREWHY